VNTLYNEAADYLLTASFLAIAVFFFWHARTNWRSTKMGINTMLTTVCLFLLLGMASTQRMFDFRLAEEAPWVRTIVYAAVTACLFYRVGLYARIQWINRHGTPEQPQRRSTDDPIKEDR
jgi:hypothetical protein